VTSYQHTIKEVPKFFHLHMVSDASGETLAAIAKAAAVQYSSIRAIKHSHPFVRKRRQLDRAIQRIEATPGVVLYTIVDRDLGRYLEERCEEFNVPCVAVLNPLLKVFETYLGTPSTPVVGGQHVLNTDYFQRIEAMNFTLAHDDGQRTEELEDADIVLIGVSRTSKTPTSLYLANRGFKTANVSLVPEIPVPPTLNTLKRPLVVGLVASPQRIAEIRRHRLLGLKDTTNQAYVDTEKITEEIAFTRRLCGKHQWTILDVTRRSIEETAAAIIKLQEERSGGG
jgi:regulator of PEP synthase PpsR (kinase-PPPase family)